MVNFYKIYRLPVFSVNCVVLTTMSKEKEEEDAMLPMTHDSRLFSQSP